ncbi:MAG TPA: hypothetical protein VJS41_06695 [Stellaceae bacterium]|nr:hypothetical protein [Stellaceae bacterium]
MRRIVALSLVLGLCALAACHGAETPQVTHWYGTGSYTTGVYDTPDSYRSPTD